MDVLYYREIIMKRTLYTAIISALIFFTGCDDTLYEVYNDFTGPVESVALPTAMSVEVHTSEKLKASVYPSMTENKNVTWASADSSIASVDSDGVITGNIVNQITIITVTTEEGGFTAQCKVTVVPKPIPITKLSFENSAETIAITGQIQLTAEITPSDATSRSLTWSSSNSSVATVDSDGLVSGLKAGTAIITAESVKWGVTGSCTVNVIDATLIESVIFDTTSYSTNKTENVQITATVLPANATNKSLSWNSSNEAVATVDSTGKVLILSPGTAAISATTKDGSNITKFFNLTATGYSVTYNGNRNTAGSVPTDSKTYLEGQSFQTKPKGDLAFYDRNLVEWNTSEDGIGTGSATVGGNITMRAANMTLYAKWQTYAIKERGPANGWIFHDKGAYSDGWRYMEAASSDYNSGGKIGWNIGGNYKNTGATGTDIGTGKTNTTAIITAQGTEINAARVSTYTRDGFDDWFLPSLNEFNKMRIELSPNTAYGLHDWEYYWTSTEINTNNAKDYSLLYGSGDTPKNNERRIRPVRRF